MNTYAALWRGQWVTVESDTIYGAQQAAVAAFQATAGRKRVKAGDVSTYLTVLNGETYVQPTDF